MTFPNLGELPFLLIQLPFGGTREDAIYRKANDKHGPGHPALPFPYLKHLPSASFLELNCHSTRAVEVCRIPRTVCEHSFV
jgi:hypothetical protein